jgi:hypothetical protein
MRTSARTFRRRLVARVTVAATTTEWPDFPWPFKNYQVLVIVKEQILQ